MRHSQNGLFLFKCVKTALLWVIYRIARPIFSSQRLMAQLERHWGTNVFFDKKVKSRYPIKELLLWWSFERAKLTSLGWHWTLQIEARIGDWHLFWSLWKWFDCLCSGRKGHQRNICGWHSNLSKSELGRLGSFGWRLLHMGRMFAQIWTNTACLQRFEAKIICGSLHNLPALFSDFNFKIAIQVA